MTNNQVIKKRIIKFIKMENTENEVGLSDSTVISEIAEFDESAVMSSLEVHSPPNVGQDDKTTNISNTNESNSTDDSGVQVTPKLSRESKNNNEVSFTDDKIESLSTPVQNKQEIDRDEKVMNMLQLILEQQSIKFEIQNNKFDEQKNESTI